MTNHLNAISTLILAASLGAGACTDRSKTSEKIAGTQQQAAISTTTGKTCVGRLEPHQWTSSVDPTNGALLTAAVTNAGACGFTSTPYYFTSLGGDGNHWTAKGHTAIRGASTTGFSANVQHPNGATLTAANALTWRWHLDWEAYSPDFKSPDVCVGSTSPTATAWVADSNGVCTTVATGNNCGFTSAPIYQASLASKVGEASYLASGINSIYSPTTTGFKVCISQPGVTTTAIAQSKNYQIMWKAIRPGIEKQLKSLSRVCTGNTPPVNSPWLPYSGGVFINVDTGDCGFSHEPAIFTSLGGISSHWTVRGATSVYVPTDRGFSIYLKTSWSAADAIAKGWYINWARVDSY